MSKLYILVGFPGAGKSTYSKKLSKETGAKIVSSDDIRIELFGSRVLSKNDKKVFQEMRNRISKYLEEGMDVICDATNVTLGKRASFLSPECSKYASEKFAIVLNRDINTCKTQNALRDESQRVPNVAIYTSAKSFVYPTLEEGFDKIIEI